MFLKNDRVQTNLFSVSLACLSSAFLRENSLMVKRNRIPLPKHVLVQTTFFKVNSNQSQYDVQLKIFWSHIFKSSIWHDTLTTWKVRKKHEEKYVIESACFVAILYWFMPEWSNDIRKKVTRIFLQTKQTSKL